MTTQRRKKIKKNFEKIGRVAYNWIRGIFLLTHNPWHSSVKTHSHLSCPFGISFTRGTNFPLYWSKFIFYLSNFKLKKGSVPLINIALTAQYFPQQIKQKETNTAQFLIKLALEVKANWKPSSRNMAKIKTLNYFSYLR